MSTDSTKPNILTRSFHWLFSWRTARRALIAFAVLATLWGIFVAEENWRCKCDWENYKHSLQAKGEWHEWDELIPLSVPDAENLYAAPHIADTFTKGRKDAYVETLCSNYNAALAQHVQKHAGTFSLAELVILRPGAAAPAKVDLEISLTDDTAREQVRALLDTVVAPHCNAPQNIMLFARPPETIHPIRIAIRAAGAPDSKELARLFAKTESWELDFLSVLPTAKADTFRVEMGPIGVQLKHTTHHNACLATEYLQASRELDPFYALVADALQRPKQRMAGDYVKPAEIKIPNFVALRSAAQDLCARAQCHLLLGEPAQAVRELAALHNMKRLSIGNHPMTLVAAMVNVAVVGLSAEIVAEGFRLNAWRAEDLAELQRQLAEIDLLPPVEEAFQCEVSSVNRTVEQSGKTYAQFFADITTGFGMGNSIKTWQERLSYCAATLAPRGWVNQNQLAYTKLMRETRALMAVNEQGCVSPSKCDAAPKLVDDLLRNFNGDSLRLIYDRPAKKTLAAIAIPNCARAMQTATRNQTRVNLALVACALERHRLAHGEYPATLTALTPEFLTQLPPDLIGGAPLKYQRTTDGKFLLYSIGWNENDDGGKISRDKDNKVNTTAPDGDWVWATK